MAADTGVRGKLTQAMLTKIRFDQMIIAVPATGPAVTKKTPDGVRDWIVRDSELQGFAIRVYPGKGDDDPAQVSFFVQRKMNARQDKVGALRSTTIKRVMGQWPALSVQAARERAMEWIGLMVQGKDPTQQRIRDLREQADADSAKKEVFSKVYADFELSSDGVKQSTKDDRAKAAKWMAGSPLWSTPLIEVNDVVIAASFDPLFRSALGKERKPKWGPKKADLATAWKCLRYCSSAYTSAIASKGLGKFTRGTSPFARVRQNKKWKAVEPRTRSLNTDDQAGIDWLKKLTALQHDATPRTRVFADFLICALIWGGRLRETQLLRWDDVNFKTLAGVFRGANTKSGRDHHFPLTPWIVEILEARKVQNKAWGREGEWVFPSRQHGKAIFNHRSVLLTLKKETGVWLTAHDLRRTVADDTAGLTDNLMMVSLTLAHSGGARAVTQNYITSRVKLLRPLFEARERKLRGLAGLTVPEATKGKIDALIEYLQGAMNDPLTLAQVNRQAEGIMLMLAVG
jgi:integrase